jgi:hypothetical protein
LNVTDNQRIAQFFLKNRGIAFPTLLDASDTAKDNVTEQFDKRSGRAPLSCIIDRQGNIVDAWHGCEKKHSRAHSALKTAGIHSEERMP